MFINKTSLYQSCDVWQKVGNVLLYNTQLSTSKEKKYMDCKTYTLAGAHYALLKVKECEGGFIGKGSSTQRAILDAFNKYNWYKLTIRNSDKELLA